MPTPEQELDLIASTAALYKPSMLYRKIELLANALLFQHEAVINELVDPFELRKTNPEQLAMFHSFSQDARSLELMLQILRSIEPDFTRASEASVEEVLKQSKNNLLDYQKDHLENLLKDH